MATSGDFDLSVGEINDGNGSYWVWGIYTKAGSQTEGYLISESDEGFPTEAEARAGGRRALAEGTATPEWIGHEIARWSESSDG